MFAGVTPVRCAPPSAAMSFICRWRGPLPLCTSCRGCASQPKLAPSLPIKALSFYLADRIRGPPPPACQGREARRYGTCICVTSAVPVISSGGKGRYESHSFVEPVERSREISLQNAAFRQAVRHRVSFRHLPSYTPAPLRGPLPLKGAQGVTGLAFVSPVLSPSFRAEARAGMNHIVSWSQWNGAEKSPCRMLPFGRQFGIEYHFATCPRTPPRHFVALSSTGKHVTGFSGRYRSPTNPVPLPP